MSGFVLTLMIVFLTLNNVLPLVTVPVPLGLTCASANLASQETALHVVRSLNVKNRRHVLNMASVQIQTILSAVHVKKATEGMDLIALISMNVTKNQVLVLDMPNALIRTAHLHVAVKMDTLVMDTNALTLMNVKLECIHVQNMHCVQTLVGLTNAPTNLGSQETERYVS